MTIDTIDREILRLLGEDARQPNAAIARVVGVSEATIRRRIKNMIGDGALTIRAVPNPQKFGLSTTAMIGIDVQPDKLDMVAAELNDRDEVGFLAVSTGRYDLLAWILVKHLDEMSSFLEEFLSKVPGIRKTETLVLLDVKKRTLTRIP